MLDYFNYWLYGVVLFGILPAIRNSREDFRLLFILMLAWPVSLILMTVVAATETVGWDFDVRQSNKFFYFRKPNDGWPGFAVTIVMLEFRFWKQRKK